MPCTSIQPHEFPAERRRHPAESVCSLLGPPVTAEEVLFHLPERKTRGREIWNLPKCLKERKILPSQDIAKLTTWKNDFQKQAESSSLFIKQQWGKRWNSNSTGKQEKTEHLGSCFMFEDRYVFRPKGLIALQLVGLRIILQSSRVPVAFASHHKGSLTSTIQAGNSVSLYARPAKHNQTQQFLLRLITARLFLFCVKKEEVEGGPRGWEQYVLMHVDK